MRNDNHRLLKEASLDTTKAECVDAWVRVLMLIATEFQLTRQLKQIAGGRVAVALEVRGNLESTSVSMTSCMRARPGDDSPTPLSGDSRHVCEPPENDRCA